MKTVELGSVATIDRKGVDPSSVPPETLYLGLEHIERGGRIIGRDTVGGAELASTKFAFTEEHVLFGKLRPNLGKISRPDFAGVCSTDILPIRPGPDLDRNYLAHYLAQPSMVDFAASRTSGANLPRLSPTVLATFPIPLPPLPEQRRIAAILDHADALRAKRRQVLAHLDSLVDAVFHQMFDMERDRLPFASTCHRVTVGVVIKPASHYVESGVPALRTLNVKPGRIVLEDLVYFSEASNNGPLAKSRLRAGDLVIARTGKAGTTAIVPPELDGANAIDLIVATPNTDVALPVYLEALLNSETGKRMVSGEARGQIQQHFNVGSLKAASVAVPELSLQREFADRVELTNRQRAAQREAARRDDTLFASLQSRAFRGEL
ncbi:restriction endonuclease subunit S [Nocardioides caldifontis]|uniref:restriction endonuclease subunit S n=1 Tax=Nocardioides caldifontis TaxID=2588938 RepID=UPI0011DF6012|nr:restriction endonuclease subunit S [Nocardioides caldifontis]